MDDSGLPHRARLIRTIERTRGEPPVSLAIVVAWMLAAGLTVSLACALIVEAANVRDDVRATRRAMEKCGR